MGWCRENLTDSQRETIARKLFQVQEVRGNELHGLCPAHDDKNASFSYNVASDVCNCFACGFAGDLITVWALVEGMIGDQATAFKQFKEKFGDDPAPGGGSPGKKKPRLERATGEGGTTSEVTKIIPESDWEKLSPLPDDWRKHCRDKFAWSDQVIDQFGLRIWIRGDEQRIAFPVRRDDGVLVNIRLYLPGGADNKIVSWGKGFGKSKLFPSPSAWKVDPIIICEGEKDTLCALSHGFNACTQTAGCNSWDDKFTRFFTDRDVVIAYDADEKGAAGAKKVASHLVKVARRVRILNWPDYMGMNPDHGQDLTDFFATHGKTAGDLKDLITSAPSETKPAARAEALPDDVKRFFGGTRGTQFKPRLVADELISWRQVVHDPKTCLFYSWNENQWEEYDQAIIRRQLLHMLGIEGTTPRVNDVLGIVRDLSVVPHGRTLNDRSGMIPLRNGMFSIDSAQVLPHQPDNFNTYCLDITLQLDGSPVDCSRWKQFLKESVGDPETITELQKFFGYCYTRETRYEKALLLIGPGGDGKGTILKVLQSLLGQVNVSNVSMGGLEDQFHRVMLVDKLLNVTTEIEGGLLQSDIFKSIVSGESVTASFKHRNAFSFQPVCKMAFSSNKHPNIQDTSEGLYRRLMMIEMNREFVKAGKADLYLYDKLMEEKNAIFLWGLRGLQLLQRDGFKESTYMTGCLDRFREINNAVIGFANTHIDQAPDVWTDSMTIYDKYSRFCTKRNYKPLGESRFAVELRKVIPGLRRTRSGGGKRLWGYEGVLVVDDYA